MSERKPYRNFKKREPSLTTEQKVEGFVKRNSQNGYFTKVSTISYKFDVSEERVWDIVGELLSSGSFESIHDDYTGEMKLCGMGKIYLILDLEQKRKKEKYRNSKSKDKPKPKKEKSQVQINHTKSADDENLPAQCHPTIKSKKKKSEEKDNDTV
jgi:hypothetical protein